MNIIPIIILIVGALFLFIGSIIVVLVFHIWLNGDIIERKIKRMKARRK